MPTEPFIPALWRWYLEASELKAILGLHSDTVSEARERVHLYNREGPGLRKGRMG